MRPRTMSWRRKSRVLLADAREPAFGPLAAWRRLTPCRRLGTSSRRPAALQPAGAAFTWAGCPTSAALPACLSPGLEADELRASRRLMCFRRWGIRDGTPLSHLPRSNSGQRPLRRLAPHRGAWNERLGTCTSRRNPSRPARRSGRRGGRRRRRTWPPHACRGPGLGRARRRTRCLRGSSAAWVEQMPEPRLGRRPLHRLRVPRRASSSCSYRVCDRASRLDLLVVSGASRPGDGFPSHPLFGV
jgi:hypothetical protein